MRFKKNIFQRNLTQGDEFLDVWVYSIEEFHDVQYICQVGAILSADEREAAGRYRFESDRVRYVFTRALAREILGAYLKREPASLTFEFGPYGKPYLKLLERDKKIQFNISHTDTTIVIAVAEGNEVGIDIEKYSSPTLKYVELLDMFMLQEREYIIGEAGSVASERFARIWSLKEAYLKAYGVGLSRPLRSFGFQIREHIHILETDPAFQASPLPQCWQLCFDPKSIISICKIGGHRNNPLRIFDIGQESGISIRNSLEHSNELNILKS
ncbi:4'-phosphopantetheinyl transferase family protein [Massilia phyllosphaerae]|uniref:4'-phosphopantetheinyl transferase family protein n=1 Tax=Massilia phyllosphaerae TaxID=3106034 RepID=UPI002B1CD608|nr:4'-phosphopantetheinyl transferase superfamily protein [Massilia sp. SGZ-792]